MRRLFREYLTTSHADETYKFVEYAEDFFRSHPMSSKPFSSPDLNEEDDSGNSVWLQAWAVEIFRVFIQDHGAQQIGCCSSVDKSEIENLLHSPSFDIFRKVQLNTLEYVENTMHSQFLLQKCVRNALQNACNYKVHFMGIEAFVYMFKSEVSHAVPPAKTLMMEAMNKQL